MPNPWDRPTSQSASTGGNPWDRPAADAAPVASAAAPGSPSAPSYIGKGYGMLTQGAAPSMFSKLRGMVANSAVGASLESTMPSVSHALGLEPTETVNSPTYASDREQVLAPQALMPGNPASHIGRVAKGALTGAGKITSGANLAMIGAGAATGGLAAPFALPSATLAVGGAAAGAYGAGQGLVGAGKAYMHGDSAGGDEQLGEALPSAAMMLPLGLAGAKRIPQGLRRMIAGDIDAPISGAEGLTPAARYTAAKGLGVNLNAADATNSGVLQAVRRGNEGSAAGGRFYEERKGANLRALTASTDAVQEGHSLDDPETGGRVGMQQPLKQRENDVQDRGNDYEQQASQLGTEAGGAQQQNLAVTHFNEAHAKATAEYQKIAADYGGEPVLNPGTVSKEATGIQSKNERFAQQYPAMDSPKVTKVIANAAQLGSDTQRATLGLPRISDLMKGRGALLAFTRDPELIKSPHMADVNQLMVAHDKAIMESLPPDGQKRWRDNNAEWKRINETFDNPSSPYYHAVRTQTPSTLAQGIGGRTPEAVDAMRAITGDEGIGFARRGVAGELLGRDGNGEYDLAHLGTKLERLPSEYAQKLFGNTDLETLRGIASDYADIKPFSKAANTENPESLVRGIGPETAAGVRALRDVPVQPGAEGPAAPRIGERGMGALRRGVTAKLLGTTAEAGHNFPRFAGNLARMNEGYRNELFSPEQHQKLKDIGTTARVLDTNYNRSGTAHQLQKIGDVSSLLQAPASATALAFSGHPVLAAGSVLGPLGYNAAQYGLGRAMNSPRFADWLMTPKSAKPFLGTPGLEAARAASAVDEPKSRLKIRPPMKLR